MLITISFPISYIINLKGNCVESQIFNYSYKINRDAITIINILLYQKVHINFECSCPSNFWLQYVCICLRISRTLMGYLTLAGVIDKEEAMKVITLSPITIFIFTSLLSGSSEWISFAVCVHIYYCLNPSLYTVL